MEARCRGFLVDSARCLESREYYRRFLEFCSERGVDRVIWHFSDDQGCSLQFESIPEIASPNAYSKAEMRELVKFASSLGISLIPELETLGHSRYITRLPQYRHLLESDGNFTSICPLHEETRRIMSNLLAEVTEVFDSPWVHVGLDEVSFGHHPLTRAALKSRSERDIFAEYISFVHETLRQLGRRMILWGDRRTIELGLTPLIPKDAIIANWQYSAAISPEQVRHFLDAGLDVILCPALITYDQQFLAGEQLALPNLRAMARQLGQTGKGKVLGIITTIWTGTRYLHGAQWCAMHLACDLMSYESKEELRTSIRRFMTSFYGSREENRVLEKALGDVLVHAPCRDEYLTLLTLEGIETLTPAGLRWKTREWKALKHIFLKNRASINKHEDAYDTFVLAIEFMSHLYERTSILRSVEMTQTPGAVDAMRREGENLYERMLATWDLERFADDPKKINACMEFDKSESVLVAFRESLKELSVPMECAPVLTSAV